VNKNISIVLVFLSLIFLVSIHIPPVESQSSRGLTINADGSVTPSNAAIQREGNTYAITADLNSPITIERGDIILDGANHTLLGPGSNQNFIAITLMAGNITVENLCVSGWRAGVYGAYNNATIANNIFTSNYQAIAVYADDYIIEGNYISGSSDTAILIYGGATRPQGDNNLITQNQIMNNNWALDIINSNGTTISKNNVTSNAVILTLGNQKANTDVAGFHLLYLNNFVNNAQTLHIPFGGPFVSGAVPVSPAGHWDNASAGNYWSDYQSRYPNATERGNSGIGNTPYMIIDSVTYTDTYANGTEVTGTEVLGNAIDHYPLMTAFSATNALNPMPTISPSETPTPPSTSSNASSSSSITPSITPSPSIPEFPTETAASLVLMVASLTLAMVGRKKRRNF
jgi:hypothetical protein